MAANLVPLLFKAGIQRDGTKFQGDYCISGQWVRFQRGVVKKIGGMLGLNTPFTKVANTTIISNIALISSTTAPNFYCFLGKSEGGINDTRIYKTIFNNNFQITQAPVAITPVIPNVPNLMWQFETVIINGARHIVCFGANNAQNISQNSAPVLYSGLIEPPLVATQLVATVIAPLGNGGICYASPYLFVYGSNGYVAWSRNNNPLNFIPGAGDDVALGGGNTNISKDKVIYGREIRGGGNTPTLLFWTLSSVIRLINVGDTVTKFQKDPVSNSSSILSSRCVVEYDGFFFWPGTDRFFVYNGVVNEVSNTMNQNYFFNNLDMAQRQKVFGVKNTKNGEIWWFYPERGQNGNSRAIIYNKRENNWYDTAISRECGLFFDDLGETYTYGAPLVNPDAFNYLWRQEVATNQAWYPNATGVLTQTPIPSSFTTPVFSWAAFNPTRAGNGPRGQTIDRWTDLQRLEPDFVMDNDGDQISLVVNQQTYAQSPVVNSPAITFTRITPKVDLHVQARQMSLTFSSTANFEMGNVMLSLGVGDGQ